MKRNNSKIYTLGCHIEDDNFCLEQIFEADDSSFQSPSSSLENQNGINSGVETIQKESELSTEIRNQGINKRTPKKEKKIKKNKLKSPETRKKQKVKKILPDGQKKRNGKWHYEDHYKFVTAYGIQFANKPFQTISWKYWKPSIFPDLAKYIGKTKEQCKSYDQRMKEKFLKQQGMDIIDFVLDEIKTKYLDRQTAKQVYDKIITNMKEDSAHMELLKKRSKILRESQNELDELLSLHGLS